MTYEDGIRKGTGTDVEELAALYDALNDHLEATINHPGWKKGVYPVREDARRAAEEGTLFVYMIDGKVASSVVLNHEPEEAYRTAHWLISAECRDVTVIHTLAVHPAYLKRGVGNELMRFALAYAREQGQKSVRLDVYENNRPAIALYEKCGFRYIDKVDLGLGCYGLDCFLLYEFIL
ncbi:MAG TPA: GNAT family N-acetyltransferase [Feifaniaceae bacterium]|nr:GNAT family N-acetyltransferase [Feifaniaceae bacterium]